jgi:hypothetical protein
VGAQWTCGSESEGAGVRGVLKYGRVALEVWWKQIYTNVIEDVALECTEYNGAVLLRSENRTAFHEPKKLTQKKYYPKLNLSREMRWIDKAKPEQSMSNGDVIEKVIERFLSLVDRVDRGQIPAIRD